jgi:hypothetical protein
VIEAKVDFYLLRAYLLISLSVPLLLGILSRSCLFPPSHATSVDQSVVTVVIGRLFALDAMFMH